MNQPLALVLEAYSTLNNRNGVEKVTEHTRNIEKKMKSVTLKTVAQHVGLTAGTISAILNRAPQSRSIPQQTKDRVFAAARILNYRPNPFAQALRQRGVPLSNASGLAGNSRVLVFDGADDFRRAVHALRQAGLRVPGDVARVVADEASAAL
jgi:DNA-binding LacI/PurR family transcriptional regulator